MAFPASTITQQQAWDGIRQRAIRMKDQAQSLSDASGAGATELGRYVGLQRNLDQTVDWWNTASGTPGLQAYARDQISDQTLDLVGEFTAMRDAALTLRDWIFNNLPAYTIGVDAEGNTSEPTVTPAQTSGFRTAVATFTATIA